MLIDRYWRLRHFLHQLCALISATSIQHAPPSRKGWYYGDTCARCFTISQKIFTSWRFRKSCWDDAERRIIMLQCISAAAASHKAKCRDYRLPFALPFLFLYGIEITTRCLRRYAAANTSPAAAATVYRAFRRAAIYCSTQRQALGTFYLLGRRFCRAMRSI